MAAGLSNWELLAGALHTGSSLLMVATLADPLSTSFLGQQCECPDSPGGASIFGIYKRTLRGARVHLLKSRPRCRGK